MEFNREEAIRARRIALKKLEKRDFFGAQRVALQAQRLYPELENLSQLLTVCKVYCAAEERMNRQLDWYGILQVEVTADDTVIKKQYDELVFWLHPNKNTLPGAEAAFKLVSEAHTVLCDHVKRSRYDIKRQATQLSDTTLANRSGVARHGKPYDLTVVFWTICPHCQKRFVYYQRNFLATCDDCGKNFFAFKLNEQAVPSTFLSAPPKNSQVSQEMVSCQQHVVPDRLVQFSKIHATGGSMDPTHTDEPMKCDGSSGGYGEVSSEARSNVVQCSAVNETHSSSASADKGTTGSVMLESLDHNIVANQNLSREDPSTVLNAAGSCNLQRLGKRKQDDCADSSPSRNSCNRKRQSKDSSLADVNSIEDKMYNDDVPGVGNQAAEDLPSTVDFQDEGDATHGGSQYKKEVADINISSQMHGNPMHDNPVITYECPDFFDFGKLRDVNMIAANQIWAIYDDHDFMPRVYAQINHVDASNHKVQLTWLEQNTMSEQEIRWTREELPAACGSFCLGETYVLQDPSMYLSHRVSWGKGKNGNSFEIRPKQGEIWALYKELSLQQSSDTDNHQPFSYDVVEVSNVSMNVGIVVSPLVRIEGFVSLFAEVKDRPRILIPSSELFRFSHSIPCYRTNEKENAGVGGLLELDTAALPCDFGAAFPSTTLDSYMDLSKKKVCPRGIDKHWLEQDIPVSCGKFGMRNTTSEHHETCAFSHLVITRCQIGPGRQVKIAPKAGEVWAIYKNWAPGWVPSCKDCPADYATGEIKMCTETSTLFAFLTKVDGYISVFKPDVQKGALEVPRKENLRFSHQIPSFRLTKENGGKLHGFYELDPAALPEVLL
uniref:J domain-containing protein n=1 Tax=Setaria italica TaxID=4555 RepID=K3ZP49_SETIT